jgi:FtsP/CotA-like multicopper oxidase with cupredoxin domain
MTLLDRRRFLGLGLTSVAAAMALGTQAPRIPGLSRSMARAADGPIDLRMDEAEAEMIDLTRVPVWTFGDDEGPSLPGPTITAVEGETIALRVRNDLDRPHAFAVAGTPISSGPIPAGERTEISFTAPAAGTYIYLDPLAAPLTVKTLGRQSLRMPVLENDAGSLASWLCIRPWELSRTCHRESCAVTTQTRSTS